MPTFNYGKHLEKVCTIKLEDGQQDPNKCPNFLRIEKFLFDHCGELRCSKNEK